MTQAAPPGTGAPSAATTAEGKPLLAGVRVLDFGRYIAGPYCATILGEYGAEIIRIEKLDGSEDRYTTPITEDGQGAGFMQMGRNKLSVTLNPMKEEGREIVRKLVRTADVVLANLPLQTLEAMGLDYESLKAIKPDIILTHVSAFGPIGPMATDVGFDGIGQAMSGTLYMGGTPEHPHRAAVNWVDFGTALHSAFGTLAALYEKQRSGRGQMVTTSLLGTAISLNNVPLIEQSVIDINRVASGNRAQSAGPSDVYRCKDGWLLVQVVGNPLFARWCKLVGEPGWIDDPRFDTDQKRGDNGEIISERMSRWCAERTLDEARRALVEAKVPCGAVLSPQQALDHPQVQAMGILQPVEYPGLPSPAPVARVPIGLSVSGGGIQRRAPLLGEHTDEVLESLGYDAAARAGLRERRVI
ncbi:MAG: CoA transferase [Burkholderiaceae bacterium]